MWKEEYARKIIHNGYSVRIKNSVNRDICLASLDKPCDAEQFPSQSCSQPRPYFVKSIGLHENSDVILLQSGRRQYQGLMTSSIVMPTSMRVFCINYVCYWILLTQLSMQMTSYVIKQLLTFEVLDMTSISTSEYQYRPRLSPRSIFVFSGGYHVLSNTSIVNNCILYLGSLISYINLPILLSRQMEYYRIIALISVNIVTSWDIEGCELASVRRYPNEGNIHRYQCNNPFII